MNNLRRLRGLIIPATKKKMDPGPPPSPILLKTSQLRINDDYQRQLSRDSSRMAITITCEFDWELYHLPVVSPIGEVDDVSGLPLYEVLDGQHTAIAAVSNGHIRELWCWPGRAQETTQSRAKSFTKLNTQRTAITPVELFWSSVAAKDEDALDVVEACHNTGASVIKRPKPYGDMRVGETICVGQLVRIAKDGGRPYVQRILNICMNLRLAPIGENWIRTLEELIFKPTSVHHLKGIPSTIDLQIENAVGQIGTHELERTAKVRYANDTDRIKEPVYRIMASIIKQEVSKHASG